MNKIHKIPQKYNSPKAQALVEYLRANFDDIPENIKVLTVRIAVDELVRFTIEFLATDKHEVPKV